jgi:hypothetical protein
MTTRQKLPPSSSPGAEVVAILNQRKAVMCPCIGRRHRAVTLGGPGRDATSHVIAGLVPVIPTA